MMLVCGEALFDVFAAGETRTGMLLDANVGGSPFNVAVGLARLGQPIGFFRAISTGFAGERLMRAPAAEGVDTRAVARLDAPTTLSLIGLDAHGVPSYAFYGAGCADCLLAPDTLQPASRRSSTRSTSARMRPWSSRSHRPCARWCSASTHAAAGAR